MLLEHDLDWLTLVIDTAIRRYFEAESPFDLTDLPPHDIGADTSPYAQALIAANLTPAERLVLILALAPVLRPQILDPFLIRNPGTERPFAEFGGTLDAHGPFLPTLETALFLLAGASLPQRLAAQQIFDDRGTLIASGLLARPDPRGRLQIPRAQIHTLLTGRAQSIQFAPDFPARRITSKLTWDDLVLPPRTRRDVTEVLDWIEHGPGLMEDAHIARLLPDGYRCLFTGPPGTGKTLTATLLGQRSGRDVYRVDLSQVVSKWVGETEKNLARVFDEAEGRHWILFFDEADALFGKRTDVSHANDRYANQEVAYILQRIEDFNGIVILASNLKGNIDTAFMRRFQAVVRFVAPGPAERLRLWQQAFEGTDMLEDTVDLHALAQDHDITGGAIVNVLRYALLASRSRGQIHVSQIDLRDGIARELSKLGQI